MSDGFYHGFEWALEQLRMGARVARRGWNGKGLYIMLQKGYPQGIPINENTADATGLDKGTVCVFLPYIMMKCSTEDSFDFQFVPWLASQTDLLRLDWDYADGYVKK
jgi:hypothetical protein